MGKNRALLGALVASSVLLCPVANAADQVAATLAALRMSAAITGGALPTSSSTFTTMVTDIMSGNYTGAANAAVGSQYYSQYLVARIAGEMQTPLFTPLYFPTTNPVDPGANDATTLIIANFIGASTPSGAHMNTIYSDNSTYKVLVSGTPTAAANLSLSQLLAVNWTTDLVRTAGQVDSNKVTIDPQNVGGYFTASSTGFSTDNSIANYGGAAGTNLRWAEALWEISMGFSLLQLSAGTAASTQPNAPAFVPAPDKNGNGGDPNFLVGQGQPACIACHGTGASSLLHGYATIADLFDFTQGLQYTPTAEGTASKMKSMGSNSRTRNSVNNCITDGGVFPNGFNTCNPLSNSLTETKNLTWDLTDWQTSGLLTAMGWHGSITGTGLNTLGAGIGKADLTYQFMVTRILNEVCPGNTLISQTTLNNIAAQAETLDGSNGNNPFGYIVASIASDPTCTW